MLHKDACLKDNLEQLRDWMTRKLSNLEQRSPKGNSYSLTGTDSWVVAVIPDWDLKQRRKQLEEMIAALEAPNA